MPTSFTDSTKHFETCGRIKQKLHAKKGLLYLHTLFHFHFLVHLHFNLVNLPLFSTRMATEIISQMIV